MSGIKESLELLDGVKVIGVAAKKVMADGKVNVSDLPVLMGLIQDFSKLTDAAHGAGEIPAEAKDLTMEEITALIAKVMEVTKAIKEA